MFSAIALNKGYQEALNVSVRTNFRQTDFYSTIPVEKLHTKLEVFFFFLENGKVMNFLGVNH